MEEFKLHVILLGIIAIGVSYCVIQYFYFRDKYKLYLDYIEKVEIAVKLKLLFLSNDKLSEYEEMKKEHNVIPENFLDFCLNQEKYWETFKAFRTKLVYNNLYKI